MTALPAALQQRIGRTVAARDIVTAAPVAAMMATLGRAAPAPRPGDILPETWTGLFCTAKLTPDRLGPDGMAKEEPILPTLGAFPRRLFGGARYTFHRPVRIGDAIVKESGIARAEAKSGRSGDFIVAVVEHRITAGDELAVVEENDIIFRPPAEAGGGETAPARPPPEPAEAAWRQSVTPDPVLLFRASAILFNAHRIHYDRDFATGVQGYPGLVVMGALVARLLLELMWRHRPEQRLTGFSYRAGRMLFDTAPFTLSGAPLADGNGAVLWARDAAGFPAMTAQAFYRP